MSFWLLWDPPLGGSGTLAPPTLTVVRASSTSFTATFSNSFSSSAINHLYYRNLGATTPTDYTGPTRTGNGDITVTGLTTNGFYLVWGVSEDPNDLTCYSIPAIATVSLFAANASDGLLAAIKSKYLSSAELLAIIPGGLYVNEVPEQVGNSAAQITLPYAVVTQSSVALSYTTETTLSFEDATVEFMIYAAGASAATSAMNSLRSVFDWCTLSFTSGSDLTTTFFKPRTWGLTNEMIRHRNGQLIFRADASYETLLSRSDA